MIERETVHQTDDVRMPKKANVNDRRGRCREGRIGFGAPSRLVRFASKRQVKRGLSPGQCRMEEKKIERIGVEKRRQLPSGPSN